MATMLYRFLFTWTALTLCETAHVTLPPEPILQAASVTFRHPNREFRFSGVYYQFHGLPKNHTDVWVNIDFTNLKNLDCNYNEGDVCVPPGYSGAYRVVCKEGVDAQTIVNNCITSEQLDLLILCVTESRARELLTGEGLRVDSERLTVILVNQTDYRPCPLQKRVSNSEITENINISVSVLHSGTCQLDIPREMPTDNTGGRDANLAFLALFGIGLIGAVIVIWFVAGCLKRRFKQCKTPQEEEVLTSALRRCPVKAYKPPKRKNSEEKCAICLEEYQAKVLVRQLMCKHSFHKACIDRWLTDKRTCPLCKQDIVGDLKGKPKAQRTTVQVQQLLERTVGRALPVEDTVELPNLQSDGSETRVHTTHQQGRSAVHHMEQSS